MRINKVIKKTIANGPREGASGTNVAGGISAVLSANVGEDAASGTNAVSSRQQVRIVQRGGEQTVEVREPE